MAQYWQNKSNSAVGSFLSYRNDNINNIFDEDISFLTETQHSSSRQTTLPEYHVAKHSMRVIHIHTNEPLETYQSLR